MRNLTPLQRLALDMMADDHHRIMAGHTSTKVLVTNWRSGGRTFPVRVREALLARGFIEWTGTGRIYRITEAGRAALQEG
jgi:hypothetical protein